MNRRLALLVLIFCLALPAMAMPGRRGVLQETPRLTWLTPGFLPPDGLVTLGVAGSSYGSEHSPTGHPYEYRILQLRLFAHWTPWSGVAVSWGQNFRRWSNFRPSSSWPSADAGLSGMGLADGDWRTAVAVPFLPSWLGLVGWAGSNIPVGSDDLGEGALSSEVGATLSVALWRESQLPEMRLHASIGHRWNGNEEQGFGVNLSSGPQPWYPQYPSAAQAGGDANNDFRLLGVGVEFRAGSSALWVEYTLQELRYARNVWPREYNSVVAAGLRWGLEEGWAAHIDYQMSMAKDEPWFTDDWYPASSDLGYTIGVSRQFGWGGSDRDGDGIPDRRDACPRLAEDVDGFRDADGCPDTDNDGDGVLDVVDLAPDEPEDLDGWMDKDGLPEPDNDGDGILDVDDQCPDEAEDRDGYKDDDGCPEDFIDADGDGIADEDDLCPDTPEDLDGFQDGDGCPEPDNDLDGIDDERDRCPDEAEDYDGDRDKDGCPDLTEEEAGTPAADRPAEEKPAEPPAQRNHAR